VLDPGGNDDDPAGLAIRAREDLVPVLERLRAFEQEDDSAPLGHRSVFDASGNDDDVARGELDGATMASVSQLLSDEEIEILARYFAALPPG